MPKSKCEYCAGTGRWTTGKVLCRDGKMRTTKVNCPACLESRRGASDKDVEYLRTCLAVLHKECRMWRDWVRCQPQYQVFNSVGWQKLMECMQMTDSIESIKIDRLMKENTDGSANH